jgi:hypothetical protein
VTFFTVLEKVIPKFIWKHKRCPIVEAILREKSNTGSLKIPDLKLY